MQREGWLHMELLFPGCQRVTGEDCKHEKKGGGTVNYDFFL